MSRSGPKTFWWAIVLAFPACALDSAGTQNQTTSTSSGSTSSVASTTGSTGGSATSSGPGGTGGASTTTGSGSGGGAGGSTTNGSGGAGGAPGPVEWVRHLSGDDYQSILDVALSPDGLSLYVVGVARQRPPTFEGFAGDLGDPVGDDVFVAKVATDGSGVLWARTFGGDGDDLARAVSVGEDDKGAERLYVGGMATGRDPAKGDFFAPGLETAPGDPFGWVVELSVTDGASKNGIPFAPVVFGDELDLAILPGAQAVAVSTCRSGCFDDFGRTALGADVLLVANYPALGTWARRLISAAGEQRGTGIASDPSADGFLLSGVFDATPFDARLPGTLDGCIVTSNGGDDVFASFYVRDNLDYRCEGARAVGSSGSDIGRAAAYGPAGGFVAVSTTAPSALGESGAYVVEVTPSSQGWAASIDAGFPNSDVFSLVADGAWLSASGRRNDHGFLQRLDPTTGALDGRRDLVGNRSAINAHARGSEFVLIGGRYDDTADFGGELGAQPVAVAGDGFVAGVAPP